MKLQNILIAGALSVFSVAGCSQSPDVDLGDDGTEEELGQHLEDFAAEWVGYVEAIDPEESNVVRFTVDQDGQGYFMFGEEEGSFPPLDPQAPEIESYPDLQGFRFPIQATVTSRRLRFTVLDSEPYRAWCEAQSPIEMTDDDGNTIYDCRPQGTVRRAGDDCTFNSKWGVVDPTPDVWSCNALALCKNQCECDASGCSVSTRASMTVDVAFEDAETVVGTWAIDGKSFPLRVTVRLTKQE